MPENTVEGFALAAELGYRWAELDVQVSSDGVAVLYHDLEFEDGRVITSLASDDLLGTAVGRHPETGEELFIPTLEQVLELAEKNTLGMVLEIKVGSAEEGARCASAVAGVLEGMTHGEVLVASFQPGSLSAMHRLRPDIPLALNVWDPVDSAPGYIANMHCNWRKLSAEWVQERKREGYLIYAYTVNSPEDYTKLRAAGVDGVFTDEPAVLEASGKQM